VLVCWRAYQHIIRQSVGWFENDFAGRIANCAMQTPSAVAHAARQVFDGLAYGVAYVLGAFVLLSQADFWLVLRLLVWLGLYSVLMRWTVKQVSLASKAASNARSALSGCVIDEYTNIYSVKMFADEKTKLDYVKNGIEPTRRTIISLPRLETKMEIFLWLLNGFLIVAVIGGVLILWMCDDIAVGVVVAATMLVFRLDAMSAWIIGVITSFFQELGVIYEGMETIAQPINLVDLAAAKPLRISCAKIEIFDLMHHYGCDKGGLDRFNLTIKPGKSWFGWALRGG